MIVCRSCLVCQKEDSPAALCRDCLGELALRRGPFRRNLKGIPLVTALSYSGPVVRLVHLAKIEARRAAIRILTRELRRAVRRASLQPVTVMAAPSSLWSRSRGRTDLAFALATSLTGDPKAIMPAPPSLYWRWQKRAQLGRTERAAKRESVLWRSLAGELDARWWRRRQSCLAGPLLLVDDVVTTGATLEEVAKVIERFRESEAPIFCLCLADATR